MKEILLALLTSVFPARVHSDSCGYCSHEFNIVQREGETCKLTHWSQGIVYCEKDLYLLLLSPEHRTFQVEAWQYSWMDAPFWRLVSNPDQNFRQDGCWGAVREVGN